jgi:hypothetical protein
MVNPQARWIWAEHPFELHEAYVRFRKTFHLKTACRNARLLISADSRYRLSINGETLAFGPARSYPWRQCVDQHDIGKFLRQGDNVIAVCVYQPGYSHFSYVHRAQAGMLVDLAIDEEPKFVSDSSWKASTDASYSQQVPRISIYGAGQEHRDMRKTDNWTAIDYDDADWPHARVCASIGQPPWEALQVLPAIDFAEEREELQHVEILEGTTGEREPETLLRVDPHALIRQAYKSSQPGESSPGVEAGQIRICVYDTRQSQVGSACVRISNARGGEIVLVSYFEKGQPGSWVISDPETFCRVRMTDRFVLAKGSNTLEPFTPRGGRYLMVAWVGPIRQSLEYKVLFRPRRRRLVLRKIVKQEDSRLNDIAEMCLRALKACAQDAMVDCPWREQAHWTGDGAVTGRIVGEFFGDTQPLRRMLELAVDGAAGDGVMPSVTPSEAHAYVLLAYSFAWVEGLASYYEMTHDSDFINSCWPALQKMLARFWDDRADDGLILSQPGRRYFLDWAELSPHEPSALYNLRFLYALQLATQLAGKLGKASDETSWGQQAEALSENLKSGFFRNGTWYDQLNNVDQSQHVASFGVLTGLIQDAIAGELMDQAVATSLEEADAPFILASPYMHYYLFEALNKLDRREDISSIIRFRWGRWLDQGAITTWENWEIDFPDGSACHSWSAHPLLYL